MSESANNPVSAPRREPIQAIQGKPEGFSDDILKGIPGFEKLPPELQARAGEVLSKIERAYPDPAEAKNQKDKFRSGLGSSLDPKDMDSSAELISGELDVWNEKILNAKKGEVAVTIDEGTTKKDETVAKKDEVKATSKIDVWETGEKTSERAKEYDQAYSKLSQKLSTLSWGKTPKELIPDYDSKLAQTQQDLVRQGQDPKLAEWALLVAEQANVIKSIESSTGKKLDARDLADLRADFAGLRAMMPPGAQTKSPADIALADPKVTLEAYSKIRLWFDPPSRPVYSDPKTGEISSPSEILTGNRTVMTRDGERCREKKGISIPSQVPCDGHTERLLGELAANRLELAHRERITQVTSRVTQGEIREKFPWLRLPELDTGNPVALQKQLDSFYSGPEYRKLGENAESKAGQDDLKKRLAQLLQSVTEQARLAKEVRATEGKNPEEIILARLAAQDRTADDNLKILVVKVGVDALGQEKYKKVRDTLNKNLKAKSETLIDDRAPIAEKQEGLLSGALLKLTGMSEAEMYPDGTISPEARIKLANLSIRTIETTLLETPAAEDPTSIDI